MCGMYDTEEKYDYWSKDENIVKYKQCKDCIHRKSKKHILCNLCDQANPTNYEEE